MVNNTVEMTRDQMQIPSSSHIILNATDTAFNLASAVGRAPQDLGLNYPNTELYGFLPLNGMEVPLMVLQTKICSLLS